MKIQIAKVYNEILEETSNELIIENNDKVHIGALFFEIDDDEKVLEVIEEIETTGTAKDFIITAYNLMKKYDLLKDGTLKTMAHWQYINGVTNEMLDGYKYNSDSEYLAAIN